MNCSFCGKFNAVHTIRTGTVTSWRVCSECIKSLARLRGLADSPPKIHERFK